MILQGGHRDLEEPGRLQPRLWKRTAKDIEKSHERQRNYTSSRSNQLGNNKYRMRTSVSELILKKTLR